MPKIQQLGLMLALAALLAAPLIAPSYLAHALLIGW